MRELTLEIKGMSCAMCEVDRVCSRELRSVEKIRAKPRNRVRVLGFDPTKLSLDEIVKLIEDLGYKVGGEFSEFDEDSTFRNEQGNFTSQPWPDHSCFSATNYLGLAALTSSSLFLLWL